MSNKKSNNFLIPDFLIKPYPVLKLQHEGRIRAMDADVYSVIYWFHSMKDGECRAGNETIAKILGSTGKSVGNSLTRLEEARCIARTYKDEDKKIRDRIIPLFTFATAGYHQVVGGVPPGGGTQVPPGGGQNNNINNDTSNYTGAPEGAPGKEDGIASTAVWIEYQGNKVDAVAEGIKRMADTVNATCRQYYSRRSQREPLQRLIHLYGHEIVFQVIALLPKTNRIAYMPTVTTPVQLENKWADLEAALHKYREKRTGGGQAMAGLEDIATHTT